MYRKSVKASSEAFFHKVSNEAIKTILFQLSIGSTTNPPSLILPDKAFECPKEFHINSRWIYSFGVTWSPYGNTVPFDAARQLQTKTSVIISDHFVKMPSFDLNLCRYCCNFIKVLESFGIVQEKRLPKDNFHTWRWYNGFCILS